jgi:hypothetical protein
MDAYTYRAALWCGPCVVQTLVEERRAAPPALDMEPARALEQIVSANGFTSESDYDSDDLPKGPYPDGGGEADTPQHCDGCGLFLRNPLTPDGYRYPIERLVEHARTGEGRAEVLKAWAERYQATVYEPGEVTIDNLRDEYALFFNCPDDAREWWFKVAGELYARGETLPVEWKYQPGLHPVDPDDTNAPLIAGASTETLRAFARQLTDECRTYEEE